MPRRYRTARAVLKFEDRYLLAVHSSFWARKEKRWDRLVLELHLSDLTEVGAYFYKGNDHIIFGAETDRLIQDYDEYELLDLRWFTLEELQRLDRDRRLHAGYELQAIRQFIALAGH